MIAWVHKCGRSKCHISHNSIMCNNIQNQIYRKTFPTTFIRRQAMSWCPNWMKWKSRNVVAYQSIDHRRHHLPVKLMTMAMKPILLCQSEYAPSLTSTCNHSPGSITLRLISISTSRTPSSLCSDNRNYSRLSGPAPCRKDKEERAKWGDRNNHLYDSISKESSVKSMDGPCWLERGFADSGDESVR